MLEINFKTAWEGAKISAVVVCLGIIFFYVNTNYIKSGLVAAIPDFLVDFAYLALFMFAGFKTAKELGGNLRTAGAAGALAAIASTVFHTILIGLGMLMAAQDNPGLISPELAEAAGGQANVGIFAALVYLLVMGLFLALSAAVNFIAGMAGGFIGERLRKASGKH
ncbi:MAG: hypothetical protein ABII71_03705 [Candidatus Micrarchaeota archaeon]